MKNAFHKPFVSKKIRKLAAGECRICSEDKKSVLEVHRIKHGSEGGKYTVNNTVCLCSNCHALHHAGDIEIKGWYNSTSGRLLRWIDEEGKEQFS